MGKKYFFYMRNTKNKEYEPKTIKGLACGLRVRDSGWGALQGIPGTDAMGEILYAANPYLFCVRVDEENNAKMEAYNAWLKDPALPAPTHPAPYPAPPLDLEDLYYFISSARGTYIPSTYQEVRDFKDRRSDHDITWKPATIPDTNATGWVSQDLGGRFVVRVDGKNKVIIDNYDLIKFNFVSNFPIRLKPKYYYYCKYVKDNKSEYISRTLDQLALMEPDVLEKNTWGTLKNIPNTNAMGSINVSGGSSWLLVRVDEANNAIIEAYNKTVAQPLPPGWEVLTDKSGVNYYGNPALKIVQWGRPSQPPVQPTPNASSDLTPTPSLTQQNASSEITPTPSSSPPPSTVPSIPPTVYEINNNDVADYQSLMNKIKSMCPPGTPKCQITLSTNAAAGGSKNKKKHGCRTKRHRKASRRKASRRKASRRKASSRKLRSTSKK
jgi:hypothetical protein